MPATKFYGCNHLNAELMACGDVDEVVTFLPQTRMPVTEPNGKEYVVTKVEVKFTDSVPQGVRLFGFPLRKDGSVQATGPLVEIYAVLYTATEQQLQNFARRILGRPEVQV